MIGIIDYGMGNIFSVRKAMERMDVPYFVSSDQAELEGADSYLLPGVGSFKDAMDHLRMTRLDEFIHQMVKKGKPLLGICLGMQLLFESSEENGFSNGLSLLRGTCRRIPESGLKVPHMGWNSLQFQKESPILAGVENKDFAYFVHSYYVENLEEGTLLAKASYGVDVPAVVGKNLVYGTQFHPEKSSHAGLQILKNFAALAEKRVNA
ncbi:imidazole glycerol phosphate synthase subunit HisH [Metabacillus sp. GX 13764]|uniref:imidazole glycerol phosphate synthase subunit HisH n=1 Tax=Metabacillus kandeliae TaxID=2900151 RepID=UPI001E5E630A|nr:imidazole glycerol phosphate synthase subunit HisH [Metabacillus kandeliae]MCD7035880.1 imidazole glycerol phosphate synthase subunit HisH [Metabacillus kandeliae]